MNREETRELLEQFDKVRPFMQAFVDGKDICRADRIPIPDIYWFSHPPQDFQIMEKEYIPFETLEEFLEALEKQRFPVLIAPYSANRHWIQGYGGFDYIQVDGQRHSFIGLLELCWRFCDGTPCGKLKS